MNDHQQIPPDYKQTEVGVIPQDWEVKKIFEMKPFVTSGSRGWALSDIDTEIAALEAKLAKARQIKHGIMQELLTSRIRLVEPAKPKMTI